MRNEIAKFVKTQLPSHFQTYNPRFISLLELYYKWANRNEGMSLDEIRDFRDNETNWLQRNIDKFISTGSTRYADLGRSYQTVEQEVALFRGPGAWSSRLHDGMLLEREYDSFLTADGDFFFDQNDVSLESKYIFEAALDNWATKFNHIVYTDVSELNTRDEITTIKVLKHLYAAKGTKKCIELFFSMYFGEAVEIYYPKFDICYIDDNFILDDKKYIRDDAVFQEYSYVIYTDREPSYYQKAFEDVYLKNFHPGGFKVTLLKKS